MRLHHLKDEEVVLVDEPVIMQPVFEARMALPDQWRPDVMSFSGCQAECRELVNLPPRGVADPDDLVGQYGRGQVDHAFAAIADHPEAVIAARDRAADEGGGELQDRVPSQGHNVALAGPSSGRPIVRTPARWGRAPGSAAPG